MWRITYFDHTIQPTTNIRFVIHILTFHSDGSLSIKFVKKFCKWRDGVHIFFSGFTLVNGNIVKLVLNAGGQLPRVVIFINDFSVDFIVQLIFETVVTYV